MAWFGDTKKGRIGTFFRNDPSLVGYWQLNGNINSNNNSGVNWTNNGGVPYAPSRFGLGVKFVADLTKYLSAASNSIFDFTNNTTLMIWLGKITTDGSLIGRFGTNWCWLIRANSSAAGSQFQFNAIGLGTWYGPTGYRHPAYPHLATYIRDAVNNQIRVYINGVLFASATTVGNPYVGDPIYFSKRGDNFEPLGIDFTEELAIFNRALSDQEIAQYYRWAINNKKLNIFSKPFFIENVAFTIISQLSEFEKQILIEGTSISAASIISKIDAIIINEIKLFNIVSIFDETDKFVSIIRNVILKIVRQEPKGEATIIKPSGRTKIDKAN